MEALANEADRDIKLRIVAVVARAPAPLRPRSGAPRLPIEMPLSSSARSACRIPRRRELPPDRAIPEQSAIPATTGSTKASSASDRIPPNPRLSIHPWERASNDR